jgi:hypothetical protein
MNVRTPIAAATQAPNTMSVLTGAGTDRKTAIAAHATPAG